MNIILTTVIYFLASLGGIYWLIATVLGLAYAPQQAMRMLAIAFAVLVITLVLAAIKKGVGAFVAIIGLLCLYVWSIRVIIHTPLTHTAQTVWGVCGEVIIVTTIITLIVSFFLYDPRST